MGHVMLLLKSQWQSGSTAIGSIPSLLFPKSCWCELALPAPAKLISMYKSGESTLSLPGPDSDAVFLLNKQF